MNIRLICFLLFIFSCSRWEYEDMEKDTELNLNNLSGIIFSEQYIPVRDSYKVLGKKIKGSLKKGEPILEENLY